MYDSTLVQPITSSSVTCSYSRWDTLLLLNIRLLIKPFRGADHLARWIGADAGCRNTCVSDAATLGQAGMTLTTIRIRVAGRLSAKRALEANAGAVGIIA